MAEEKKGATIFDLIGGVTDKKREWKKWSETDQKKFSPFIFLQFSPFIIYFYYYSS